MEMNIENENIRKFLEKVEKDKELQEKFSQIRDPEEAYKLAASVQEGFTKEEFVSEMKRMYHEMMKDLSEEDLAKVAGGLEGNEIASIVLASVSTVAATTVATSVVITGVASGAAFAAATI